MAKRDLNLDNLPGNSVDPPEKEVSVEVSSGVKTKGWSLSSEIRNIGNALFSEIIIPGIRGMVGDFFHSAIDMTVLGKGSSKYGRGKAVQQKNYNRIYRGSSYRGNRPPVKRAGPVQTQVFNDLYFDDRNDANRVLGRMMELTAEYGWATVGDLYQMSGQTANITHEDWGWQELSRCRVHYTADGWLIDFPDPIYLR